MKIVTSIAALEHPNGLTTGFVPTMGAFHEGHLDLMRAARRETDRVVVSLFVNPTQFGQGEDLDRYPRNLDRDIALADEVGVDILFAPSTHEIYPRAATTIHVPEVTELWEGSVRPTHFAGVATVVCKLFNIVRPTIAYFGAKDLQQCLVIQRMVEDLNIPVIFSRQPTTRENDGLAMSSRNVYLSPENRAIAPMLYQQLTECRDKIKASSGLEVSELHLLQSVEVLNANGFKVDYFELIDLETAHPTRSLSKGSALIVAARLGNTRLIDNVLI